MALRILSSPPPEPEAITREIREAIESALPGARVEVRSGSPGHFEIHVVSESFAGLPRVKQQQRVYAAIRGLMEGDAPPVHAVDRMVTQTP